MYSILSSKLLLFFAISIISFYITSDTTYAHAEHHQHKITYIEYAQKNLSLVTKYIYDICFSSLHYIISFFINTDDVKIQIRGAQKEIIEQDRVCDYDVNDQYGNNCKPGDLVCQDNMNYYKNAFFLGKLVQGGVSADQVNEFDTKFCGYIAEEKEILKEHTDSLPDDQHELQSNFNRIKKEYEDIDYADLV